MLPEIGSPERDQLEAEAIEIGLDAIHETDGNLAEALYKVYEHYRERFIQEYDLMDSPPSAHGRWVSALHDARTLEKYVGQCWATAIVHTYVLRRSTV